MKRPVIAPETLALLAVSLLAWAYNGPLWNRVLTHTATDSFHQWAFIASWPLLLVAFIYLFVAPLVFAKTAKPLLSILFIVAATTLYFSDQYGVAIDRGMIQNLFETDWSEAGEYFNLKMFSYLGLYGLAPIVGLYFFRIRRRHWARQTIINLGGVAISLAVISLIALSFFPDYASLLRNDRQLRLLVNPTHAIYSLICYQRQQLLGKRRKLTAIALDVHKSPRWQQHHHSTLLVIVVGETARAQSFALNGYQRDDNPRLKKMEDVVNFTQVTSCGTATAKSLPCMFSPFSKKDYDDSEAKATESLLDVVRRSGLPVVWLDNNSGCKGVCDRVAYENLSSASIPDICKNEGECYDEILLQGLKNHIADQRGDLVLVLHQKGSHGPAYYQRVPQKFEKFTPSCHSNSLSDCSQQEVINAYDNTILYTDWFLSETIGILKTEFSDRDSALVYISDHGESLGENHLYLHGAPELIAPKEQTHVPMIAWLSANYAQEFDINSDCIQSKRNRPMSHDHLFHSVLGLLQLETSLRQPQLDIFDHCHREKPFAGAKKHGAIAPI